MLVGNLGSDYRFSYNVLGDHVNLGSRLEGLNKLYGTEILISETTALEVKEKFTMREIDTVRVLGREQPLRVFELIGLLGAELPHTQAQALQHYAAGLEAYRQYHWDEALELFRASHASWPQDTPSRTMSERCLLYQQTPPPEAWDGVFDAQSK
jgi:adenylate cyclase